MQTIQQFDFGPSDKVLMRVDFNVPLDKNFDVTDNTRLIAALPSIRYILGKGASIILLSHLGRPKGIYANKYSLKNICPELSNLLNMKVQFSDNCIGTVTKKQVANLQSGEVLLLENVRFHAEETKGDAIFAHELSNLGCNVYVNDAFGTAHRAHASTYTVAQFFPKKRKLLGLLMAKEIANATKVLEATERPFTAILGGAKVSDKILLIENLLEKVDNLLIGGGMAFTFLQAQGGKIGKSLVELDRLRLAEKLLRKAEKSKVRVFLPTDVRIANDFSNNAKSRNCDSQAIPKNWMGLDIGEETQQEFANVIGQSKTVLWNGPMGVFEFSNFAQGTKAIAQAVANATQINGTFSLIGGGDSVAAIKQMGLANQVSYVSTGGGALLKFLEGRKLPGIRAVLPREEKKQEQSKVLFF